ncbi:hypothetical protein [Ornithinimicrobium kibberense]|uniref:hypothetical protein n=1 Tax=Ornithinimicrobium kibberense TaxID=282060 RepID=UPI00361A97C2
MNSPPLAPSSRCRPSRPQDRSAHRPTRDVSTLLSGQVHVAGARSRFGHGPVVRLLPPVAGPPPAPRLAFRPSHAGSTLRTASNRTRSRTPGAWTV